VGEYNWAALAIPVFLGATLLEAWIARRRDPTLYAFGTALSDLACGSLFQAGELVLKLLTFSAYVWLFEHRWIDWPEDSAIPWVLGIVGVDLLFYLWHRASHVVNVLWAVHGVHHQSEDYNLAVALRQPLFEPLTWFVFYAVLALAGVSPLVYLVAYGVNRLYQFWIHTELVRTLPAPCEWVLNTPSHHRVHHGVQPQYLDKNFGAVLILWDRLFGTFEPEGERVKYGTTVPLRSYNPLWANLQHLARIRRLAGAAKTTREAIWAWFAHPAWVPAGFLPADEIVDEPGKYRPPSPPAVRAYVVAHMTIAAVALTLTVFFEQALAATELVAIAGALGLSFVALLGLVERTPWATKLEALRLLLLLFGFPWLLWAVGPLSPGMVVVALFALAPLWWASFRFLSRLPTATS